MNDVYVVYFGAIVAKNYHTKQPAVFFSLDKANEYAKEMNDVGIGGYFVVHSELKPIKVKKEKVK